MILLLALLLAQEKVVMVARHKEKPSIFSQAGEAISKGWHRLYQKEDEQVSEANALAAEGKPDAALHEYDASRARLKESPELAYDRSTALVKSDPEKAPEAASEAAQAMVHGDASLRQKAAYQLGVSQEAMGKPDEAMKSYASALTMDPDDEDAKVNLELLLKTQEERKQQQQQQQSQQQKDKKQPQQDNKDQKQESKNGDDKEKQQQPQQDQGKQDSEQKKQAQQQPDQQQQAKPEEKKEQQAAEEKPVDRSEAERLLDALRSSEKNLQTWRFAKEKRKNAPRVESEKDW